MNNEEKMLQLVLSDKNLSSIYDFNPADFPKLLDAIQSNNPVIVAIAKIINGIHNQSDKNNQKELYLEVVSYLKENLI